MARGKYAKAISDRSGMEFPYHEMMREWNGSLVHRSEFESKHPQLEIRAKHGEEQGLMNARPDRTENEVIAILGPNPFETIAASSGIINVSEFAHGRSTGDTVRFRGTLQLLQHLIIQKILMVLQDPMLQNLLATRLQLANEIQVAL